MKFTVSDGEKYQKVLNAEIPVEEQQDHLERAYKRLANRVNIPGFRKGKAPKKVLENYLGMPAILEEMANLLVVDAYEKGVAETGIQPVDSPTVNIIKLEQGQPLIFDAAVTVRPEVKLGQYKGIKVARRVILPAEEEINREIEQQQKRMGKLAALPEGSAAAAGNTVRIDYVGTRDGVAFDGGSAEDYPLELGSNTFIPGFEDQLIGIKAGEERDVTVTFPADYGAKELAGQEAVFHVKAREVMQFEVPELNDEFVKDVSETAETVEQYREEVKKRLEERSREAAGNQARNNVMNKAVENMEVDVPPVMIDNEVELLVHDMEQRLAAQGLNINQFLEYSNQTMAEYRESYRNSAELRVKRDIMLDAIIKEEKIEATDEEVEVKLKELADNYYQPVEKMREALEKNGSMESFRYNVCTQKAADLIFDTAEFEDEELDRDEMVRATTMRAVNEMRAKAQADAAAADGEKPKKTAAKKTATKKAAAEKPAAEEKPADAEKPKKTATKKTTTKKAAAPADAAEKPVEEADAAPKKTTRKKTVKKEDAPAEEK